MTNTDTDTHRTQRGERADIAALLHDLAREFGVQGAALAILRGGGDDLLEVATGIANARSGEPVSPQHLFLVGSTTKLFTATLVLQLVDDGRVDLDAPVREYIPELRLHDALATDTITVRHLLSHTSGIDNGPYADHGRGANAVGRYVAALAEVPLIDRPGKRFSYSNAGLVVAGRLVEKVTGLPWDVALQQRLLDPAGLTQCATLPERAILHPVAVPHLQADDGGWAVAGRWGVAGRAMGPTGSTLAASAGDLARFAAIHVRGGQALNGTRILSAASAAAMQMPQVTLPPEMSMTRTWCLGWFADEWSGRTVLGHTGHNVGTGSFLCAIPQEQAAIALVFNSGNDAPLYHFLFQRLLRELFGIEKPDPWAIIERHQRVDLSSYAGTFARHDFRVRLEARPGEGALEVTMTQGAQGAQGFPLGQRFYPANRFAFGTGQGDAYQVTPPDGCLSPSIVFDGFIDGRPTHLYSVVFAAAREGVVAPG